MKVTCPHEKLRAALESCERVISKHLTLPILNNVLLKTDQHTLTISATNLEIGVTTSIPCRVVEQGSLTVPVKVFYGIISNLGDETVELTSKNKELLIKTKVYSGTIRGEGSDEFPIIPSLTKKPFLTASGVEVADALGSVVAFTALSETRPELTGVFFKFLPNSGKTDVVAADGFRLARAVIKGEKKSKEEKMAFIVPQRTISEVIRLSRVAETTSISAEQNQVEFLFGNQRLVSRLIEGSYVDYETLIPKKFSTETVVSTDELIKNIRLVSLLSSRINDIHLEVGDKEINFTTEDPDLGKSRATISATTTGDPLKISFNWRYLQEGLQHITDKKSLLRFVDNERAALIQEPKTGSYVYIVMPLRT
jgi:DNA polymerase-3 subunit beta